MRHPGEAALLAEKYVALLDTADQGSPNIFYPYRHISALAGYRHDLHLALDSIIYFACDGAYCSAAVPDSRVDSIKHRHGADHPGDDEQHGYHHLIYD